MNIMQYCSVCKAEYDMSVVPTSDGDDDGVVWLQCPSCKGFLPKVSSSAAFKKTTDTEDEAPAAVQESDDTPASADDAVVHQPVEVVDDDSSVSTLAAAAAAPDVSDDEPVADDPLADMDISLAMAYRPWESYAEGDVIHHLAWDDYGVVVAKETLPGNRKIVQVQFAEAGIVRLIEQEGDGS